MVRAATIPAPNRPVEVREYARPELEEGAALLRTLVSEVCGTDLYLQQGLLPDGPPSISGFDVAGFSAPADETGGDTYDFLALPDGRWLMAVADASGHGIGPALVIAETRAMLRAISVGGCELATVLHTVNGLLAGDLEDGRFVTCFLGILDPAKALMTYAAAGQPQADDLTIIILRKE